jgi:alpha-tubulin suppressor-like RCC1 family protein
MSRASRSRRRSLEYALSPGAATAIVTVAVLLLACAEAAAPPEELPVPIARVRLSLDSAVLMEGETLQLSVVVSDSAGELLTGRDVLLYSMNSRVATVAPDGSVDARSYGSAMIVARAEGVRDTAWIDVQLLFQTVSAGAAHTCGISATGNTYCWGEGSMGRLGSGADRSSAVPVLVDGGLIFSALSAGGESTCALTGFAAFCWGSNNARQLGTGGKFDSWVPAAVAGSHVFQVLEVGTVHACGLASDGAALCWGSDWGGQIGNGARPRPFQPDTVAGGQRFAAISPGWSFTCGATTDGVPYCWGFNEHRQLGADEDESCHTLSGDYRPCSTDPLAVGTTQRFSAIVAGTVHVCGLTSSGNAYCWGANDAGQLGIGTTTVVPGPTPVVGDISFAALTAGDRHTCGLTADGAAYCWGDNALGALGTADVGEHCQGDPCSTIPVRAAAPFHFAVVSASRGPNGSHTCGVTPSGHAYCWGRNTAGQLGAGAGGGSGFQPQLVKGQPEPSED